MPKETVEKLGGKVKEFTVHYSRKVSDGNFGSTEVGMFETISVGAEEDYLELERGYMKQLRDKVNKASAQAPQAPPQDMSEPRPVEEPEGTYNAAGDKWCEEHQGWMTQKSNDNGTWYSHKVGDKWCNG
jgi:hypothetical protein